MKRKTILNGIITISAATFMVVAGVTAFNKKDVDKADALTKPTTIDLNDTTEVEIRNYYSYLNDLPAEERRGQNLLKNLKYILVNNPSYPDKPARYFSYGEDRDIYNITDRNWYSAPASGIVGYNPTDNKIYGYDYSEDPYLYYYYRDDNFRSPHTKSAIAYSKEGKSETMLNQEHIWSKSHGFAKSGGVPNAGSDLHHLVAADTMVNSSGHGNIAYGYVNSDTASWVKTRDNWDNNDNAILNNHRGDPRNPSSTDTNNVVFEPRDEDKGDFARALLYMVARYNYIGEGDDFVPTIEEPNLELVDYVYDQSYNCDATNKVAYYGKLGDILDFHRQDPVVTGSDQDFEVHRNNLIYSNFQYTRNPFIDFPEWVELIWGDKKETGCANPQSDMINDYGSAVKPTSITLNTSSAYTGVGNTYKASVVSVLPEEAHKGVVWTSQDTSIATVSSAGLITGVSTGTTTITATSSIDNSVSASLTFEVRDIPLTSLGLNKTETSVQCGGKETLTISFEPSNASIPTITWTSSDSAIASITNGRINGISEGETTITASDGNGHSATCLVTVSGIAIDYSEVTYELVESMDDFDINRKMIIAANTYNYALGPQATNNRTGVEITKIDKTINIENINLTVFTVEQGTKDNTYSFKETSGYIYAAGSNANNYLKTQGTKTDNSSYALSFGTNGTVSMVAQGTNTNNILRYNISSKLFSCYGNITDRTSTISLYQQKAIPLSGDIPLEGISLNKTSMKVGTSMSKQLQIIFAPAEATNKDVTWYTTDPYTARVDEEGNVYGVTSGNVTISVVSDDGGFSASCEVSVVDSGIGNRYYQKVTSLEEITDGQYVIASLYQEEYYALPSPFPTSATTPNSLNIFVSNNRISESNASGCYVDFETSTSDDDKYIKIIDSNDNYLSNSSSTNIVGTSTSTNWLLTLAEREGFGTFRIHSTSDSTRHLVFNNSNAKFGAYTYNSDTYYDVEIFKFIIEEYTIDRFVTDFMGAFTCDNKGLTEPVFKEGWSWSMLKAKYESLTPQEQQELTGYQASELGNAKAQCVARYDYIVKKYGVSKYPNWMNRTISPNANVMIFKTGTDIVLINIIIGSLLALSIGSFIFFYKRKKKYN